MEGYRLSPQQDHLWSLQQEDKNTSYQARCAILIEGCIDDKILKSAIQTVVDRHEILRSAFHCLLDVAIPVQIVTERALSPITQQDIRHLTAIEQQRHVDAALDELSRRPIDLIEGLPLNVIIVTVSDDRRFVLIRLPGLCADKATLWNLAEEITSSYAACARGAALPAAPIQYSALSDWLNELIEGEETRPGRDYWRRRIAFNPFNLKLPLEARVADESEFNVDAIYFEIDSTLTSRLESVACQNGASVGTFLLSCWQALLWRVTSQPEVTVGMAYDGRRYDELKDVLGLFTRYLPIQLHLEGSLSFVRLLRQVDELAGEIHGWQEFFSWDLLEERRNGAGGRFLPFLFEYEEERMGALFDGVKFTVQSAYACAERFKVKLSAVGTRERVSFEIHYDASLFEREYILRIGAQFQAFLESAVFTPDSAIGELEIVHEDEGKRLLCEYNRTSAPEIRDQMIHRLIERQVERSPNGTAVSFEDQELSYAELNERSNQLARHLRRLGVKPEALVPICMDRSIEMVVGLLAILKAGGAYVPIDPDYPEERRDLILSEACSGVLLTERRFAPAFAAKAPNLVCVDSDWPRIETESRENLSGMVCAENLAYVIYTSGSTGRPKGVMISHGAICNRLLWMQTLFGFDATDRILQKTPYSFDASVWEIFVPLLAGAKVVMLRPGEHRDSGCLAQAVAEHKITVLQLVPSMFRILLQEKELRNCKNLRRVFCGGEALSAGLRNEALSLLNSELINLYGPTENSIDATYWPCKLESRDQGAVIGRPISNVRIYLLDSRLKPVATGMAGELYIGGAGLSRGYLRRCGLTAERFTPDPFAQEAGSRLYRTGDLARYLPDGNIEFLRRVDSQVKIRGYRIELGEIEAVLKRYPAVNEAVVLVKSDGDDHKSLVAYVLQRQGEIVDQRGLARFLEEKLPEYMVPSHFVLLDEFPQLLNGKLDYKALQEIGPSINDQERDYVPPRTAVEEIVAGVWGRALDVKRINARDNFFVLGGHSLMLTQVISRLRDIFKVQLPILAFYEAPTVAELSLRIQEALAAGYRLQSPPLSKASRHEALPLSFAQQRLWFLAQLDPGSAAYNLPMSIRLSGRLNHSALENSLREIVRRHESLRTIFVEIQGKPVQRITEAPDLSIPIVDLRGLGKEERESVAKRLAMEEAVGAFDLATGPMLRAKVVRVGDQEQVVMFTAHHIVSDGWSMGVLIREVSVLYEAYSAGEKSPLAELEIQYADYAVWQREWLSGEALEEQLRYWKEALGGRLEVLELPTDRPRGAAPTRRGGGEAIEIREELSERLREISREEGVTLFMTLLAGFKTLLRRYSGQEEIIVGTPIANRNHSELEGLIGCFVNTLALRSDVSGDVSYREVLRRVREVSIGAYAHQDLPFEILVEELVEERDLSVSPLFQVMFALQNVTEESLKLGEVKQSPYPVESLTAKYDLTMMMSESAQGMRCWVEYDRDLFDRTTIGRMLGHYERLLGAIAANPGEKIAKLRLLSEEEERQIIEEWNETEREYVGEKGIHEVIEEQAERRGDAIAVVFEDEEISYRELNKRANALACRLVEEGVGDGALVGIYMERCLEMVIGLLGILKAGGAYIPLDPSYPSERIAYMMEDSGAVVMLTNEECHQSMPETRARVINVDEGAVATGGERHPERFRRVAPESLAYVIYTSGSTGKPKGAMNTHRGIRNRLLWMQEEYGLNETDIVLQKTPISFDVSVWEFFWPLMAGARIVLARPEGHKDPQYLVTLIKNRSITTLHFVPSMLEIFLEAEGLEQCGCIKRVMCSGEALSTEAERRFFGSLAAELHNLYGPTEAAVDVTRWRCQRGGPERVVPIGSPIANTQIYLLDGNLEIAPVGVYGELHIAGMNLGRGYLNRPDLTAEKFIPNPYARVAGARMYKTGDLARHRNDGEIEYSRRIDQQVKVRGFRIELGEVESALREYKGVREAVALVRSDDQARTELVAYIVPEKGSELTTDELRRFLKRKLPEYATPSVFIKLESLTLTPNGKVDRRALLSLNLAKLQSEVAYVAPRSPAEEIMAGIWGQVLGVDQVGIHDNFFAIGGDSIRSIRVLALAKGRGYNYTLQDLFQRQTISELVREYQSRAGAADPVIRTEAFSLCSEEDRHRFPDDVVDAYPLTKLQAGMLYHIELMPDTPMFHNINSVRLRGRFDVEAFQEAVQTVVDRHPVLRTSFHLSEYSEPLQLVRQRVALPVVVEDLRHLSADDQLMAMRAFVEVEKTRPFDLACPPLMRLFAHRLTEETFQFTTAECHAILDGWSYTSTLAEIFELYFATQRREPVPLKSPLMVTFRDFVALERMALESEECQSYWGAKIRGCTPIETRRRPFLRYDTEGARVREVEVRISSDAMAGLNRIARAAATPFKTVLLAAHVKVMSLLSGNQDVLTGLSTNGRPVETDGEEVRGLFLNTAPLRLKLRDGSWHDLVRQIFEAEQELLPFRRFPLSEIQKMWGRQPLIETAFNYVHFHVFEDLLQSDDIELLDYGEKSEESNFSLLANFHRGVGSSSTSVTLRLNFDTTRFSAEQMVCVEEHYSRVLDEMARNPMGPHGKIGFPEIFSEQEKQVLEKATNIDELDMSFSFSSARAALAQLS